MPLMLFGQQAIIDLALNGREKGYICKVENNYQMLSERHIRAYCAKHGFVVVNVINKYGGVVSFSILPKNEVDLYVYNSKIGEPQKCGYSRLTATGKGETFVSGKLDFKWSGNVTDGMINGTGSGFAKISDKQYCYVHAEFVNGLPKGDVEFVKFDNGIVYVRLVGACAGCAMQDATLKDGLEALLLEEVPGVVEVVNVSEEISDENK